MDYAKNVERGSTETNGIHDTELKRQQEINDQIVRNEGTENQYKLHEEMGKWMTDNVTVVRYNDRLKATDDKLLELQERFSKISINDSNLWATQAVPHARQLWNMLQLARVITLGALNRNESRGAHYKPEFPERDDENFLKTTIAEYSDEAPVFSYEAVDVGLVEPRKRDYSSGKAKAAAQVPQPGSEQKPYGREELYAKEGEQIKEGGSFKEEPKNQP
jgi:succinate dehydrogenase / fumarate reductase flavoprotein subunit